MPCQLCRHLEYTAVFLLSCTVQTNAVNSHSFLTVCDLSIVLCLMSQAAHSRLRYANSGHYQEQKLSTTFQMSKWMGTESRIYTEDFLHEARLNFYLALLHDFVVVVASVLSLQLVRLSEQINGAAQVMLVVSKVNIKQTMAWRSISHRINRSIGLFTSTLFGETRTKQTWKNKNNISIAVLSNTISCYLDNHYASRQICALCLQKYAPAVIDFAHFLVHYRIWSSSSIHFLLVKMYSCDAFMSIERHKTKFGIIEKTYGFDENELSSNLKRSSAISCDFLHLNLF